jgi:predicted GIY-YIG superfamily endonuclease
MWHYVYILESRAGHQYVGSTSNVNKRLVKHNKGDVSSTAKYRPWEVKFFCSFPSKTEALKFEKYLKSGSGTTFRYRHLVTNKRSKL